MAARNYAALGLGTRVKRTASDELKAMKRKPGGYEEGCMAHQGVIEVLLTDAEEWPEHSKNGRVNSPLAMNWQKYRGTQVRIILAPKKPSENWTCGTDLIWPVVPEDGIGYEHRQAYVCRHQIQIGD